MNVILFYVLNVSCTVGNLSTVCTTVRPLHLVILFHAKILDGVCDGSTVVFSYLVPGETSQRQVCVTVRPLRCI